MDDHAPDERPIEPLVENIAMRDTVPAGWRRFYDQLIVDLYRLHPALRVTDANAGAGELLVHLAPDHVCAEECRALLARARIASRNLCEICGEAAAVRTLTGTIRCLCDAHHRAALATHAARTQLFDGDAEEAEQWMQTYSVHLGAPPAQCAGTCEGGLQRVLTMIWRLEAGVYI